MHQVKGCRAVHKQKQPLAFHSCVAIRVQICEKLRLFLQFHIVKISCKCGVAILASPSQMHVQLHILELFIVVYP